MSTAESQVLRCQCGAKLRVPAAAAGRRVKCPQCEFKIQVPHPDSHKEVSATAPERPPRRERPERPIPAAAPAPPPTSEPAHDDGLLDDLMNLEQSAEATESSSGVATQSTCPSCKMPMASDAVVCPLCGFDKRVIEKSAKKKDSAASGRTVKGTAVSGGRFLVGVGLSSVGALVGALVWFGIAVASGREFGLIAIALGFLAGYGMALGYGKQNLKGGIAACFITFFGIVGAKILIFSFVVYAMLTGNTSDVDLQRSHLVYSLAEERMGERGYFSDSAHEEHWEDIYAEAEQEVENMTDEEVRRQSEAYRAEAEEFDLDFLREEVADHRATLRVWEAGEPSWGDAYDRYYDEEMAACGNLSREELESASEDIESWNAGAKWSDEQYTRNYLIYEEVQDRCNTTMESASDSMDLDDDDAYSKQYAAAWAKHYPVVAAEIDQLTPDERTQKVREIEAEQQRRQDEFAESLEGMGLDDLSGTDLALGAGAAFIGFFVIMFGLWGTIFTIFAISTAYKVANGGTA